MPVIPSTCMVTLWEGGPPPSLPPCSATQKPLANQYEMRSLQRLHPRRACLTSLQIGCETMFKAWWWRMILSHARVMRIGASWWRNWKGVDGRCSMQRRWGRCRGIESGVRVLVKREKALGGVGHAWFNLQPCHEARTMCALMHLTMCRGPYHCILIATTNPQFLLKYSANFEKLWYALHNYRY